MNTEEVETLIEEEPTIVTTPEISEETRKRLLSRFEEEGQVIINCKITASFFGNVARIWDTTYLLDEKSNHKSRVVYIDGITKYPVWTEIPAGTTLYFTLVFSALPKSCKVFDLLEQILESGRFYVANIMRNSKDVYSVDLTD